MKKILFIVNPKSGNRRVRNLHNLISGELDNKKYQWSIATTESPGHATKLAKKGVADNVDIIVAVGGDGSMNEAASGIAGSKTALALIPAGSGNGLARHLNIPLNFSDALQLIKNEIVKEINICKVNHRYFFNIAGVGFDGSVAYEFSLLKSRGFWTYIACIIKLFFTYKSKKYYIEINGRKREVEGKIISFANAQQYGNNFIIAPDANDNDGLIDICIVKRFFDLMSIRSALKYLVGKYYVNHNIKTIKTKSLIIESNHDMQMHLDGEPYNGGRRAEITVAPEKLRVIVGSR